MNQTPINQVASESAPNAEAYSAPVVLSAVKVTEVVRGGSGFQSDANDFFS